MFNTGSTYEFEHNFYEILNLNYAICQWHYHMWSVQEPLTGHLSQSPSTTREFLEGE